MPKDQNKIDDLINNQPLGFENALYLLRLNHKMKRSAWNDIKYIAMQKPDEKSKMRRGYIYAVFQDGQPVPYNLQNADIFSNDWVKTE